ncbi:MULTISPECIES: hypothetical protein [Pseudomonas]|uniref:hypothetical protein n=1 Tax=Pseudomonas TaxID=286 RepID=UPI001F17A3C1|nr:MULTISPECIES: hypothetical protein [Pseudomonas]MDO3691760.1 hypothetical protein [Pseudomonas sp. DKN 2791]MDO7033479.1 hypothetical protein [Pseudomonas sp. DKN 2792]
MLQTKVRNPSTASNRIAAHRSMALAALHANSSLSTRLARYNHHMQRARSLELLAEVVRLLRKGGVQ